MSKPEISFSICRSIAEYQPLLDSAMNTYGKFMSTASAPEVIAEQIFAAATDESRKLRFPAGDDAPGYLAEHDVPDEQYFANIAKQFGLPA